MQDAIWRLTREVLSRAAAIKEPSVDNYLTQLTSLTPEQSAAASLMRADTTVPNYRGLGVALLDVAITTPSAATHSDAIYTTAGVAANRVAAYKQGKYAKTHVTKDDYRRRLLLPFILEIWGYVHDDARAVLEDTALCLARQAVVGTAEPSRESVAAHTARVFAIISIALQRGVTSMVTAEIGRAHV